MFRDFNKRQEDFGCLRDYNNYLEFVEDIIYNLSNNIDIVETNKKIHTYKEVNKEQIMKNRFVFLILSTLEDERAPDQIES